MTAMRAPLLVATLIALAAAAPADPDWPCVQRLVPSLTAETLWPGHASGADWRADPAIAGLVRDAVARGRSTEDATALIARFVATRPGAAERAEIFAGLVDEINAQRAQAIARLHDVARRERALADATARVTAELRALPPGAPAAQRDEVVNRRALMIREYEEVGRTVRYACEIPVDLEGRLGQFAQVLQRGTSD